MVESDPGKVVINASFYFIFFPFPSVLHFPFILPFGNMEIESTVIPSVLLLRSRLLVEAMAICIGRVL